MPAHRNRAQYLVFEHRRGEGGGGQVRDAAGDRVAHAALHRPGQVVIAEPQQDPDVAGQGARVQRGLQVVG
jgi:hypothetical protein